MKQVLGIVAGVMVFAAGSARGQTSNQPGHIRTTPSIPMRTGFTQPIRTSAGDLSRLVPGGGGRFHGTVFPAYITTGTSLSVTGDGLLVSLNGGLANQLGFNTIPGNAYGWRQGSTTCIAVPDANVVLANLPANVQRQLKVLRGADYGWNYDVICAPGRKHSYPSYGYGYGWYPSGYTYYRAGQYSAGQPLTNTNGWSSLGQPGTQQPVSIQPTEPPEPIEVARVALVIGDLEVAEQQYREHLAENPDDSAALREFALVMFEAERTEDGFAALRKAYRDDPDLAGDPLDLRDFGFDGERTRRLMTKISPIANRLKTSSGWLSLAAVLQWQGKDRAAVRMLDRAEDIGLDSEIVTAFRAKLES